MLQSILGVGSGKRFDGEIIMDSITPENLGVGSGKRFDGGVIMIRTSYGCRKDVMSRGVKSVFALCNN